MHEVLNVYYSYIGNYPYIAIFYMALLFCYVKFPRKRAVLVWPNIIMLVIILNPYMKKIIEGKFLGGGVYWRLWWLIPVNLLITIMFVYVADMVREKKEQFIVVLMILFTIILSGKFVFNAENFVLTENQLKMSNEILDVSSIIETDIGENQAEIQQIVAVYNVAWQLRMYNPNLRLLYGRNPEISEGEHAQQISDIVNGEVMDVVELKRLLKKDKVNYLVVTSKQVEDLELEGVDIQMYGYNEIGRTTTYRVYLVV